MPDLFGAVGDLFGGIGDFVGSQAQASGYKKAAAFATSNATLARSAGDIELMRERWKAYQSFGATRAALAGSGVRSDTGTSLDLLAEGHRNAALDAQLIDEQTNINVNTYNSEAASYSAQAKAAQAKGIGGLVGGVLGAIASIF